MRTTAKKSALRGISLDVFRTMNTGPVVGLVLAMAGFCIAILTGLAEAQGAGPAATPSVSVADNIYSWVRIAQAVATIIALTLGGIFAWRRGFIFRHQQPTLLFRTT